MARAVPACRPVVDDLRRQLRASSMGLSPRNAKRRSAREQRRTILAVGRSGNRRRKPARHLPKVEGEARRVFQQSPYSYEGAIESIGIFARGTRGMSAGQARVVRRLFALTLAVLVLICVAAWVIAPRLS